MIYYEARSKCWLDTDNPDFMIVMKDYWAGKLKKAFQSQDDFWGWYISINSMLDDDDRPSLEQLESFINE